MYDKISIGLDQSYTRTGISIAVDGKLRKVTSIPFRGCTIKPEKRKCLANILHNVIKANLGKAKEMAIICERIRMFSQGNLSMNYIKATGALIGTIVDVAHEYGIKVYSADTRSWKAQIVGTSKSKGEDKKLLTIKYVKKLGFDVSYENKKGKVLYDDDAADSACLALYAFSKGRKLKLEE